MSGVLVGGWLALALIVQIGAHVALVIGLARRRPRWRAIAALVVPPLAPVWGWREMPGRARTWAIACGAYAVVVAVAQ